jgi:hypothetical protein
VELFFEEIVRRLATQRVEFVVVGGLSAVLHGAPIVTQDIDICFRRTKGNIARLVAALAPMKPRLRDFPPELPFFFDERSLDLGTNFTFMIGDEAVDLLTEMSAIGGYEQVVRDAPLLLVGVHQVRVLSLENLIQTKRAAGRPKDLAILPVLEATLAAQSRGDE